MNVGEYGHILYFNLKEDVSANTNKIILQDPSGNEVERDAVLGTSNLTAAQTGRDAWTANYWVQYTVQKDDIDEPGMWGFKATSEFSGAKKLETDWKRHKVKS